MIHTKFCGNWRFLNVFYHVWIGGHLGHVTQMPLTNFCSPHPRRLHIIFGFDWPSGFVGDL